MEFIRETKGGVLINVHVVPGSKEEGISYDEFGKRLRVRVSQPAVKDKANKAVLDLVSRIFGECEIVIVSGERARKKTLLIKNTNLEDVKERLNF